MKIRLYKPPRWITWLRPRFTWRFFVTDNTIFLTFDDGPHPNITPFILDELKKYNWKATFFCVGENVERYPEIVQRIQTEGHTIGNHTHQHVRGTTTSNQNYLTSIQQMENSIPCKLFRPPYGRITPSQAKAVSKTHQIILWSWLSYDYDLSVKNETILSKAEKIIPGDIIVLHDNPKIASRQKELIPQLFKQLQTMKLFSKGIK